MELARLAKKERIQPEDEIYRAHFQSDPVLVGAVVDSAIAATAAYHSNVECTQNLEIALAEIINNIAEHAYGGATDGAIELTILDSGSYLNFLLVDQGVAMPGLDIPVSRIHDLSVPIEDLPEGGFGWFLIRTLVRDLRYQRIGGKNRLSFNVPRVS